MAKSVLRYSEYEGGLGPIWGRLIFLSCMATGAFYVIFGVFACRRLIAKDTRWIFISILYFFIGVFHAFFTLALLCFAVACVFKTFDKPMLNGEMILYSGIMTVITLYFACGRKAILYSL
ncbi:hypothetical protein N2W54_003571 [Lotmaria passim]